MGWFKDKIKSIGRTLGRGIEKVGDFFGNEKLSNAGRSIQEMCTERVASERSYDKKEANIYTTDRLNEILITFSEGYLQQANIIEKNCIRLVEEYFDSLIQIIEDAPGVTDNSANLRQLKNRKGRIAKTISGAIKEPLAKRMSLDDSECLRILKLDSGDEKRQQMTNFTSKVIKEALNNLIRKVRNSLIDQTEDINDYLNNIAEEQEKAMQVLKESFDKMINDNELEEKDIEKNCINSLVILKASEYVCQILQ